MLLYGRGRIFSWNWCCLLCIFLKIYSDCCLRHTGIRWLCGRRIYILNDKVSIKKMWRKFFSAEKGQRIFHKIFWSLRAKSNRLAHSNKTVHSVLLWTVTDIRGLLGMLGLLGSLFSDLIFFILHVTGSGSFPSPLSAKEERECLERMKSSNPTIRQAARNHLIEHNLRLVAHIINNGANKRKKFLAYKRTSYVWTWSQESMVLLGVYAIIATKFDWYFSLHHGAFNSFGYSSRFVFQK